MTDAQLKKLAYLLVHPDEALVALPQAEREEYKRCQKSVVEARRTAEREGAQYYVN